ncbi:hypothetical protein K8R03_04845 [Candidatus Kaiserbacteria bacterium]|nr:hypothetical protein [Candidatus Kaiserbacteria bacterium]
MVLLWDFYEIRSTGAALHGVKLRGRLRKFTIENDISCLMENASDEENVVRFAVPAESDAREVIRFVRTLISDVSVTESLKDVPNPVLSKLNVNNMDRYEIS